MKQYTILVICLMFFSFFIEDGDSWSKDTIIWGHNCIPPLYSCEGDKVTGIAADIENIIFENLKDYNHQRLSSNVERLMDNMKIQDILFCNVAIAKNPEREKFACYSIPAAIVLPIHIFIRKEDYSIFGGRGTVSLENILRNHKLKFGYPSARSFGAEIDSIINAHSKQDNVYNSYSSEVAEQPLNLLIDKRIDYTIGGYFAMKMAAQKQGVEDKIFSIKIHEKQDYLVLYVVCPKNDWGKAMVSKINNILRKEIPTKRYFDIFKPLYDNTTQDEFKKQYEKLLIKPISE